MVRTRDSGARKAVAAKAPRKVLASSGGGGAAGLGSPSGKVGKYAGGNGYCPRPTPDWQKGIGAFIVRKPAAEKENSEPVEDTMETVPAAASTTATEGSSSSSSQQTSSEVADSSSQGSSSSEPACSTNSQPEPSSPVKKNGLISDSDEDE